MPRKRSKNIKAEIRGLNIKLPELQTKAKTDKPDLGAAPRWSQRFLELPAGIITERHLDS